MRNRNKPGMLLLLLLGLLACGGVMAIHGIRTMQSLCKVNLQQELQHEISLPGNIFSHQLSTIME